MARKLSVVLLVMIAAACGGAKDTAPSPTRHAETAKPAPQPEIEPAKVVLSPEGQPPVTVTVEVVSTPGDIQRGLMYRRYLPANAGMLFLMPEERIQSFWMKNCLIPLDMIFISSDMVVAGVVANAEPGTTTSRRIDAPSLYVLEVNAGFAKRHGIARGTPVAFTNVRTR